MNACCTLDEIIALNPRSKIIETNFAARFARASHREIELAALNGLEESLVTISLFSFELRKSAVAATVAGLVVHDMFTLAAFYAGQLCYSGGDKKRCVSFIIDLLLRVAADPSRRRIDVKAELISASLLAAVLRNASRSRPALEDIKDPVVLRDDLYRSLDKHGSLATVLDEIQRQFAPPAWVRS